MYQLVGNVGQKPELRYTPGGKAVLNFSVAQSNDVFNKGTGQWDQKPATWIKFTAWEDQAMDAVEWMDKGTRVFIEWTKLALDEFQKQDGTKGVSLVGKNVVHVFKVPAKRADEAQESDPADEIS